MKKISFLVAACALALVACTPKPVAPNATQSLIVEDGGTYREAHGGEFTVPAIAWLKWQLKGDQEAARMFQGEPCGLAQREGWTTEKNALID